jgi:hypothetical protein
MTALPPRPHNFFPLRFSPPVADSEAERRAMIELAAYLRAEATQLCAGSRGRGLACGGSRSRQSSRANTQADRLTGRLEMLFVYVNGHHLLEYYFSVADARACANDAQG